MRVGLDGAISESTTQPAIIRDSNGVPEIWFDGRLIVKPDSFGSEPTLSLSDLTFSPDRRRIAYSRTGPSGDGIWISTVFGDPPVRLGRESAKAPSWSPDGNSIAYFSMRDGHNVLMRAQVGSLEPPQVIAKDAGTYPRWSPKGNLIAAIGPGAGITLVNADGSNRRTAGDGDWLVHDWARDASTLYGIILTSNRRLALVSLQPTDLTQTTLADLGPAPVSTGAPPLKGFTITEDGRGFVTSILRTTADIWRLQ